jgi:predicted membrane-bound spermidine synthase
MSESSRAVPLPFVYAVFLLSGFAALVYQVVWQRSLEAIYGVDIESVTIVVSAFLLGLGLGSWLGGRFSERPGAPLLAWFGVVEIAIGLYGACSLWLFHAVGAATAGQGGWLTFAATFGLVLVPTMGMGSTLPLLVAHAVPREGNVGKTVGMLYFTNTLGSAFAACATAVLLLGKLGQARTVWLAVACNVIAGGSVLWRWWRTR